MVKNKTTKKLKKYPEGHFINQGIAIGIAIGVGIGAALGNVALGIPIGVAVGISIGYSMEEEHKKKGHIRHLKKAEKRRHKRWFWISLIGGILLFLFILLIILFS